MAGGGAAYAIKAAVSEPHASHFVFNDAKTMYGGKHIAAGDPVFVFASENEGGKGLVARGTVNSAEAVPRTPSVDRQTPRVSIIVRTDALATRPLGRQELRPFAAGPDAGPEAELWFKFYRQATNKIVGISGDAAAFLNMFFPAD